MRIFKRTREKLERILREEIDEPRERQSREIVAEAENATRTGRKREADGRRETRGQRR